MSYSHIVMASLIVPVRITHVSLLPLHTPQPS